MCIRNFPPKASATEGAETTDLDPQGSGGWMSQSKVLAGRAPLGGSEGGSVPLLAGGCWCFAGDV